MHLGAQIGWNSAAAATRVPHPVSTGLDEVMKARLGAS